MTTASDATAAADGLTICIVASEESGDRLGGALMGALALMHRPVRFVGAGGRDMARQGLQPLLPVRQFAVIGFGVLRELPAILRYIRDTAAAVVAERPDVLVIIDSPDLTHRIAKRVRKLAPAIPVVNYVSPSVWAWRPGRARRMRAYVDHVLALLPFEPDAHRRLGGPHCSYVGHPLIEAVGELRPSSEEAARRQAEPPVLLVLPGSRTSEINRLLGVFGETVTRLHARVGPLEVVVPTLPHLADAVAAATRTWPVQSKVTTDPAESRAAFRVARAALVKSGTVTLEVALAGVPMVAAYKVTPVEELIGRLAIKVPSIILPNLIIGENVVPEFIQRDCTADRLADALAPLLADSPQRRRQTAALARLDQIMQIGSGSPSRSAAEIVLRYAMERRSAAHAGAGGVAVV